MSEGTNVKPVVVRKKSTDEDELTAVARVSISPVMRAAATLKAYECNFHDVELADLVSVLDEQVDKSKDGDSERAETMLTAQAHTLDAIFNTLARKANSAEFLSQLETYLKLALRAQSQCRATWEALSTIQHPPMANYVGQANITSGPQQVNNSPARGENRKPQNELLEQQHGNEWLDPRAASTAGRTNQELETVGAVNRTKDTRG